MQYQMKISGPIKLQMSFHKNIYIFRKQQIVLEYLYM